ncbi:MAG: DASS family sodium-coupled anion symporter [Bacteroidia bacterium]
MKSIKLLATIILPLIVLFIPNQHFPLDGITVVEQRVVAIFLFAALSWILEPIPIYATSLAIILFECILISNKAISFVKTGSANYGQEMNYADILHTFASPIIILFLGGFFLALAATKYRLDQNLARVLLAPFGHKPKYVMMGIMVITAVFSMFMSNTATTAMMLSILTPVLALMQMNDKGKIGLLLSVPVAANIGGIGTPIGTPPNAVALKYLTGDNYIGFGEWMTFAVPFVLVLMSISWLILIKLYPSQTESIKLEVKGKFLKNKKAYTVYATFIITILLWLTDFIHGMNSYVVALIPVTVFSITGIVGKKDLQRLSWDVLWLVSGGIALGLALDQTGLANRLVSSIDFQNLSPLAIIAGAALLAAIMANFMSNTATANLLLPLMAVVGTSVSSLVDLGGLQMIVLITTLACSMGMALPISTPPNALAFGSGLINTQQMAKPGVIIASIGIMLSFGLIAILQTLGFFS